MTFLCMQVWSHTPHPTHSTVCIPDSKYRVPDILQPCCNIPQGNIHCLRPQRWKWGLGTMSLLDPTLTHPRSMQWFQKGRRENIVAYLAIFLDGREVTKHSNDSVKMGLVSLHALPSPVHSSPLLWLSSHSLLISAISWPYQLCSLEKQAVSGDTGLSCPVKDRPVASAPHPLPAAKRRRGGRGGGLEHPPSWSEQEAPAGM